jgi:hypothetical protein
MKSTSKFAIEHSTTCGSINGDGASNNNSGNSGSAAASSSSSMLSSSGPSTNKSPPPLNICIVINLLHYITPLSRLILLSEPLDNTHYNLYHSFASSEHSGTAKSLQHMQSNVPMGISELERQSFVSLRVILSQLSSGRNEPINIYPFLDKFCLYTRSSFQSFDELDVSFVWDQIVRLITTTVPTLTHIFHGNILFTRPHDGSDAAATAASAASSVASAAAAAAIAGAAETAVTAATATAASSSGGGSKGTEGDDNENDEDNEDNYDMEDISVSISNLTGFLQDNANSSIYSRCFQSNFNSSFQSIEDILRHTATAAASIFSNNASADNNKIIDTTSLSATERVVYNNARILLNEPNVLVFIVDSPCLPPPSLQTKAGTSMRPLTQD